MNKELPANYGLYKSIDLLKDGRINVFCKAGGGVAFFTLLVVGFFIANQQFLFPFSEDATMWIQYALVVVCFILYAIIHELIHFLTAKILKIDVHLMKDGILPYTSIKETLVTKKEYIIFTLSPIVIFSIILIPTIILTRILAENWFWLPWIIFMQNVATSAGDIVACFYIKMYKNCYFEDNDDRINVYAMMDDFKFYHDIEQGIYEKKALKLEKKRRKKEQLKNAPKTGKKLYEDSLKKKNQVPSGEDNSELDDLSKLDM